MTAIEQAKYNIARAEELAQAVKEGKKVEFRNCLGAWNINGNINADEFFRDMVTFEYRIIEPKRRRPWTREEAERHIGWVLVSPDGKRRGLFLAHEQSSDIYWPYGTNKSLQDLCENNWHVHLPGQPDDLKPCSVEE